MRNLHIWHMNMQERFSLDEFHNQEYRKVLFRLVSARKEAKMTQKEVASKLGKPQSFVSRSETGEQCDLG